MMEAPMVAPAPTKKREPARKAPLKKEAPRKERCARCGVTISSRRTPCVWHQHVVCEHCHSRLRAFEPGMAFCPGAKPYLPYARGATDARPHGVGNWITSLSRKLVSIF